MFLVLILYHIFISLGVFDTKLLVWDSSISRSLKVSNKMIKFFTHIVALGYNQLFQFQF